MNLTRLGALGAALAVTVLFAAPAWAHNALVGTDPGDGASVSAVREVEIEFAEEVLRIGMRVIVADEAGVDQAVGDPEVRDSRFVYQAVRDLSEGAYNVTWRVVGEDGHPIQGSFSFTVLSQPAPPEPTASPGGLAPPSPVPVATPSPTGTPAVAPPASTVAVTATAGAGEVDPAPVAEEDGEPVPTVVLIAIGALVAVAATVTITLATRRARS